ncbi:hypothetical protein [Wenyingzhuangia marina]|uniref:HMA domain-containing protein n=1 Tax=Wenyingzhuangia marina TaxID=1195760 RepID=A0A1M5T1H3_9FLAO|nr:hypothetical protein [Wenyingzhuangia marina]GGF64998.1 hypothetical protein GCM10011397_04990 [Wenyingzhuangia marina]SHH44528.1 hypothetical protein SAMN05444281_0642 [Wenyingzhuangia marina]
MLPFRTEIRNSPKCQTLKVYINDTSCDQECKDLLNNISGIESIEIQKSISRDRVEENLTIYIHDDADVNRVQKLVENKLDEHFAFD